MADRVDAAVDLMEPSPPDAQVDCAHAEARPEQLLTRDQSVLLPRELPDHPVQAPRMQLTITMNVKCILDAPTGQRRSGAPFIASSSSAGAAASARPDETPPKGHPGSRGAFRSS